MSIILFKRIIFEKLFENKIDFKPNLNFYVVYMCGLYVYVCVH